ncbi:hypothetical protein [Xanthomonas citri]|nr:hypothetical protein [Xanthomonas citri]
MTKSIQVISASKFATTFSLRPELHAWLLGAGASAASGIPTGYDMILDFKAKLYCQETRFPRRNVDPSDPLWVQRIDEFFSRTPILPPPNDPAEYAAAFEAIYPQETHRRQYIDDAISKGTPWGSPPFSRTLTRRPIKAMRSVHVKAQEVHCRVQAWRG